MSIRNILLLSVFCTFPVLGYSDTEDNCGAAAKQCSTNCESKDESRDCKDACKTIYENCMKPAANSN